MAETYYAVNILQKDAKCAYLLVQKCTLQSRTSLHATGRTRRSTNGIILFTAKTGETRLAGSTGERNLLHVTIYRRTIKFRGYSYNFRGACSRFLAKLRNLFTRRVPPTRNYTHDYPVTWNSNSGRIVCCLLFSSL